MSSVTREDLWARLTDAGLVEGDVPPSAAPTAPWFVRAMLGVAGWIAALFLLGFVGAGLAFVFRSEAAALVVGAGCCGLAYFIFRQAGRNDLAAQFGLAVSLAGQAMFVFGVYEGLESSLTAVFLGIAIFEAILAVAINNFVHRAWSATAAALAFSLALLHMGLFGVGSGLVAVALAILWLDEPKWALRGQMFRPIGYGLVFALLLPNTTAISELFARARELHFIFPGIVWARPILIAGALILVVYRLLARYDAVSPTTRAMALTAAGLFAVIAFRASGVAAALIILLLGFAGSNRALLGLGTLAMLGYLSQFYYSLQATLLTKSLILVATGLLLIALWAAMRFLFSAEKEPARA